MKNGMRNVLLGTALASGLVLVTAPGVAHAQGVGAGRLDGTWDIALTPINCDTGGALTQVPIRELATFHGDGTVVSSTAGVAPAAKTPGHGVWGHVGGQTYTYGYKFFRFDATGLFVGWSVVRQDAVLDSNGDAYVARGGLQMYDPNGNPVGPARCSTTVATRFE